MSDLSEPFLEDGLLEGDLPHSDVRGMAVAFAAGLALYCISASPVVFWGDSADFSLRALELDADDFRPIARGYSLHTVLMWLFGRVMGDAAFGANLVSALFGAVTVAIAYEAGRMLGRSTVAGVAAAATLGLAHTYWTYAGVAEVYTLHTAFLLGAVLLALRVPLEGRMTARLLGLVLGLAMLHHRLILFAYPCFALWLVLALRPPRRTKALLDVALGLAVGVLPFAVLCVTGSRTAPEGAGDPFLWWFRDVFMGGDLNANHMLQSQGKTTVESAVYLGRWMAFNLPGPALLLALYGAWCTRKALGPRVLVFLTSLVAVHLVFPLRYDWTGDQYAFLIPLYPIACLFVAIAVGRLEEVRGEVLAIVAAVACAAAPIAVYGGLALTPFGDRVRDATGLMRHLTPAAAREFFLPVRLGERGPRDWCVRGLERLSKNEEERIVLHSDWGDGMVYRYLQAEMEDWDGVEVRVWYGKALELDPTEERPQWVSVMPYRKRLPPSVAGIRDRLGQRDPPGDGVSGLYPVRAEGGE